MRDLVEGAVAVTAGLAAASIALIGFDIDSAIEVAAAGIVLGQRRAGARAGGGRADESVRGIVLNGVALVVMVPMAGAAPDGARLGNEVLQAQAREQDR